MNEHDVKQLIEAISKDRKLREQLWSALIADRENIRHLADALHEFVRDGGKLPK